MPNVYVEPRPKARPEGTAIDGYVLALAGDKPMDGKAYKRKRRRSTPPRPPGTSRWSRARATPTKADQWREA